MAENLGKWPSKRGPISKIRPSDGCGRDAVPLAVERWYDFPEFGGYLGNVGSDKKESNNMRYVSATEAKQRLAALLDAAQREPVTIRRQKRDVAVIMSPQEYERLRALNTAEFQRFCDRVAERAAARGLTEDKLTEILGDEG